MNTYDSVLFKVASDIFHRRCGWQAAYEHLFCLRHHLHKIIQQFSNLGLIISIPKTDFISEQQSYTKYSLHTQILLVLNGLSMRPKCTLCLQRVSFFFFFPTSFFAKIQQTCPEIFSLYIYFSRSYRFYLL